MIIWGEEAGGGLTAHCHHYYPPPVFATVQCWAANGSVGYIESFAHRSRPQAGGISGFFDMIIMVIIMIMIIIMMIAIRDNDRHTSTTFLCYILPKNIVEWVLRVFLYCGENFLRYFATIHNSLYSSDFLLHRQTSLQSDTKCSETSHRIIPSKYFLSVFFYWIRFRPFKYFLGHILSIELALASSSPL